MHNDKNESKQGSILSGISAALKRRRVEAKARRAFKRSAKKIMKMPTSDRNRVCKSFYDAVLDGYRAKALDAFHEKMLELDEKRHTDDSDDAAGNVRYDISFATFTCPFSGHVGMIRNAMRDGAGDESGIVFADVSDENGRFALDPSVLGMDIRVEGAPGAYLSLVVTKDLGLGGEPYLIGDAYAMSNILSVATTEVGQRQMLVAEIERESVPMLEQALTIPCASKQD